MSNHTCPECGEFIGLPQHHKYSCPHWNYIPEPSDISHLLTTTRAILFALLLALVSCTVAPELAHHKTASQWMKENRVGYDSTGYFVKPEWVRAYHAAWQVYGKKLPIREQPSDPDSGIVLQANGNYHVTFLANRRFDHMNEMDANYP